MGQSSAPMEYGPILVETRNSVHVVSPGLGVTYVPFLNMAVVAPLRQPSNPSPPIHPMIILLMHTRLTVALLLRVPSYANNLLGIVFTSNQIRCIDTFGKETTESGHSTDLAKLSGIPESKPPSVVVEGVGTTNAPAKHVPQNAVHIIIEREILRRSRELAPRGPATIF